MQDSESQDRSKGQGEQGGPELLSSERWHRFAPKVKSLGIVILIFGCAELLMGLPMAGDLMARSYMSYILYIHIWQGTLYLVCGILSIYTGIHPSMTMVTGCLVMYVGSIIGVLFSVYSRLHIIVNLIISMGMGDLPETHRYSLLFLIEAIVMISSVCVLIILIILIIFLTCASRSSLDSTHTQIVLHQIDPPVTETPTE